MYVHASAILRMRSEVPEGHLPGHHIVDHELADENQWAYKQGNSTEMVDMTEYWRGALDSNLVCKRGFCRFLIFELGSNFC